MDSGNSSGSMQSSSGGEEEYDSRAESSSSFSALFLNNHPQHQQQTHLNGPFSTATSGGGDEPPNSSSSHNLNPLTHQHHTPMFDPLSSYYLDHPIQRPISSSTTTTTTLIPNNHLISLDMMWSTKLSDRSEPNQSDLGAMMQLGAQNRSHVGGVGAFATTTQQHSMPPQQQAQNNNGGVRNPKKRSRASRRAPTTVLTTDTTNFRAMVQEFTGIPAPPFTSSTFPRTRLDLFGSVNPSSSSGAIRSNLEPPYLLRPFAQKVQPFSSPSIPSFSFPLLPNSSSSMVDTLLAPNNNNSSNSCVNNSTSINYQQVNLNNNMHNNHPNFSFNSILQAQQQKYPPPLLGSKTHQPSLEIPQTNSTTIDSSIKMGVFEELGLMTHPRVNNTTQVGGGLHHHQNMVHSSSDGALSRINNNNNDGGDHGGSSGVILSPLSNIQERVSNGKMNNYMASDFHHGGEKGPECGVAAAATTAARTEGMVESWINCSSD